MSDNNNDDKHISITSIADRILDKLDKIDTHLGSVDITLAKQHVSLEEHIKRTNLIEEELRPIKRHVGHVEGALKLIGLLSVVATLVAAVLGFFNII